MQTVEAAELPPTKKNKLLEIISDVINLSLNKTILSISLTEKAELEVSRYDDKTYVRMLIFLATNLPSLLQSCTKSFVYIHIIILFLLFVKIFNYTSIQYCFLFIMYITSQKNFKYHDWGERSSPYLVISTLTLSVYTYVCHGPDFSVTPIKSIFTCEDGVVWDSKCAMLRQVLNGKVINLQEKG